MYTFRYSKTMGIGQYYKGKLELKSNSPKILPDNCKFTSDSTPNLNYQNLQSSTSYGPYNLNLVLFFLKPIFEVKNRLIISVGRYVGRSLILKVCLYKTRPRLGGVRKGMV